MTNPAPAWRQQRRAILLGLGAAALGGCKRKSAPTLAEVWDEEPVVERAEAIGALAPPWPAPQRGQLDNGLILFGLHEPGGVGMRVRLLIPTSAGAASPPGEAVAVAAEHARFDWQRRLQRFGVTIAVEPGPHRVELVATGTDAHLPTTLAALRAALSSSSAAGLDGARERLLDSPAARPTLEVAASATVRSLFGIDEGVDPERLAAMPRAELALHWQRLVDPRRCVLLVHTSVSAEALKADLRRLTDGWRGVDGPKPTPVVQQATLRLRRSPPPTPGRTRLLAEPTTPLVVAPGGTGPATLVLGRTIPLAGAEDRAMARLAQRVAQEELDASLAICGDVATFLVATTLRRSDADADVQRAVGQLATFAVTRQPRQRLFGAVQLWLGARVVEASLAGEDWTRLFAQAIDLADSDAGIAGALAGDAKRQLAIAPDALEAWTRKWLQPRTGEPGWAWAVAGADPTTAKRIARLTTLA